MRVFGVLFGFGTLAILVFVLFKGFYKSVYLPKQYARDIENKVRWIVIKSLTERDEELFEYIEEEQYKLNIEDKFLIDFSNEKDFVCEILETHRQSVIESFFYDLLKKDKALYNLNSFEYYMWSLCCFLEKNSRAKSHDIIYYKLYYIVSLFCANNENVKSLFANHINTLNNIKKNIEKEGANVPRNTTL